MITELLITSFGSGFLGAARADIIKQQSESEYARAASKAAKANARMIVAEKKLDNAYMRMFNKKKSVLSGTFIKFTEIAGKLSKIENCDNELATRLSNQLSVVKNFQEINMSLHNIVNPLSDKQLGARFLFGISTGFIGVKTVMCSSIMKDAKLDYANTQDMIKESKVHSSFASLNADAYDALAMHLTNLANQIQALNILFVKSINHCKSIIDKKGSDFRTYNKSEKDSIVIMFDIAETLNVMVCTPVLDKSNKVTAEIIKILNISKQAHDEFCSRLDKLCEL